MQPRVRAEAHSGFSVQSARRWCDDLRVTDFAWPQASDDERDAIRAAWPDVVKALPIGGRVAGIVIGR